ncbi:sensor domain-containing diguanylate cyclase [Granulosicoccus antarcticus]|uniref:Putative diguanylate cyclase YfiN n=1 Tax=Granulosicoccus antarcticus IMCC3135 TaxID=1192854 RepID=A0A2Z2P020_9GAMM|nr:diguanylate cyclase [Granulosicoccus antarcticus]ASJ76889.1 putative diguanylate cyclase YfiN [Granulosicoccus antarcticus IMCC3135]
MTDAPRLGLQSKLAIWLLVVLIPVVVAGTACLYTINLRLSQRIEADLMNTRRLEAARITEALANYKSDVESLVAGRDVVALVSRIDKAQRDPSVSGITIDRYNGFDTIDPLSDKPLQQLVDGLDEKARSVGSEVVELKLSDMQGKVLGSTAGFAWEPYDRAIVAKAIAQQKTLFGNAFRANSGEHRMGMVSPVYDLRREIIGVLQVEMRLEPIVGLVVAHEGFGETSEAHIAQPTVDGDAEFITLLRFKRKAAFNKIVPKSKNLPINWSLESPGGQLVHSPDYRSIDSILAIETLPETGWGLVVKIDAVEAFQPVAEVQRIVLIATIALMMGVVLGWILFLRPLGQRMQRLSKAADRIASGDLHSAIGDSSVDEIGMTSRSIDKLAKDLLEDINRRAHAEQQLLYRAHHDELTGLFNRMRGNELIELLDQKRSKIKDRAILFLDLNGFKAINDQFGHDVGDQILVAVAKRLKEIIGGNSALIRWGGDEFVIVALGADARNVHDIIERLNKMFSEAFFLPSGAHNVGCSIGLSAANDRSCKLDTLLIEADARMYEDKQLRKAS